MPSWADLNERQQEYMQAVYETDQEQEADERGMWKRGGTPRPAREWRWMEYGVFNGIGSMLYTKLYLRKLIDEGTGSTFNALETRGYVTCKYTNTRRNGERMFDSFLMLQITKEGRSLVRSATGAKAYRPSAPGVLREWHWRAMVLAWKDRPAGVQASSGWYGDYGNIGWNTWLRLKQYKVKGEEMPLIEEYQTKGSYNATTGVTHDLYWLRLTPFGEQFYRDNWQRYHDLYPDVDAPTPDDHKENEERQ